MIRIVLENLLLFFLPTLAYIAYRFLVARTSGRQGPTLDDAPFFWLFAAGAAVVVGSIAFFASSSGGRPGEAYAPPVLRDGRIVPGHRIENEPSPQSGSATGGQGSGGDGSGAERRPPNPGG